MPRTDRHIITSAGPPGLNMKHSSDVHTQLNARARSQTLQAVRSSSADAHLCSVATWTRPDLLRRRRSITSPSHVTEPERGNGPGTGESSCQTAGLLSLNMGGPSLCEQFEPGSVNHSHYQTIWDGTSRQRPLGGL